MQIPTYLQPKPEYRRHRHEQRQRKLWFDEWKREQAKKEYRRWVDYLPHYSADGYKDVPHRNQSLHQYGVDQARKAGDGDLLKEKKEQLRTRWSLASYVDIRI